MFNNLLILPKSGVTARRRALSRRRLVPIYGTEFSKKIGGVIAPIRHNWGYAFSPETILKLLNEHGMRVVQDTFAGMVMDERLMKAYVKKSKGKGYLPFKPERDPFSFIPGIFEGDFEKIKQSMNDLAASGEEAVKTQQKDFVENFMPRLDAGLRQQTNFGTIQFLLVLLILGFNLGISPKFFLYIISNIATTEAISYGMDKAFENFELTGNSIFGYTNYMMSLMLFLKKGWASNWSLYLAVTCAALDFVGQFFIPAAAKSLHFFGLGVGWLWGSYGYGLRLT